MPQAMAATLDRCIEEIRTIEREARSTGVAKRPRWSMIVLRAPKGRTAPGEIDGHKVEGFWRVHQVPIAFRGSAWPVPMPRRTSRISGSPAGATPTSTAWT